MRKLLKSFKYAFNGIFLMLDERNFRIHFVAVLFVTGFAASYGLPAEKWTVLVLVFALVLSGEMINSAIEALCDKITTEKDEKIKKGKDIMAGAVLVRAIIAITAAIFLFGDISRLAAVFSAFCSPILIIIFIIFALCSALFIFLPEEIKKRK